MSNHYNNHMKKLLFSLSLCMLLSATAMAQIRVGLKAGAMLSNTVVIDADSLPGSDAKISYLVGGFLNIPINSKFSVQPELLYANKGGKDYNRHYINLPIMLQYKLIDKLKVEVGPELGYLFRSYSEFSFDNNRSFDNKDLDVGINFGVSYDVLEKLNIGLRYNMGIIDTHDFNQARFGLGSSDYIYPDFNVQNRTLQLSVGWKLGK